MKVVTVLGTRPEIIRLSAIIAKLDQSVDHTLVHTGQNFDRTLSDIMFAELGVRAPDIHLGVSSDTVATQIGGIFTGTEQVFTDIRPDRLLLLGDTNSALCAMIAKRMGIFVLHMEAGNRCYDDRVPEEVNRRLIDHSSDVLMPYTERSRANLIREGIAGERIFVTGNPIFEIIERHRADIDGSSVLADLGLEAGHYFLVTLHRAENVDIEARLCQFARALEMISERYREPVIVSTHPRTAARLRQFSIETHGGEVRFPEPFGFFDFVALEKNARCVLSDSGTVQEECAILTIPNVTLRDVTERPETVECGSNMLSGADPEHILHCVETVLCLDRAWRAPPEYLVPNVSDTVMRIVTGFHLAEQGAPRTA